MDKLGFEVSSGGFVGRDPREMGEDELNQLDHFQSPLSKVIRLKCKDCCAGSVDEVAKCTSVSCDLWPYRMGKNPFTRREMSDKQRADISERLIKYREGKNAKTESEF